MRGLKEGFLASILLLMPYSPVPAVESSAEAAFASARSRWAPSVRKTEVAFPR